NPPADAAGLRRRAEERLKEKKRDSRGAGEEVQWTAEETKRLVQELQVHQIELEMQNEELRRSREEREALRERYFNLYELAPVGYFTLSEKEVILEANLAAARLLGVAKSDLIKQPLDRFILPEDQDICYRHRQQLLAADEPQVCELRMLRKGAAPFWARIQANRETGPDGASLCRAELSDISEQKRAEEALQQFQAGLEEHIRQRTVELAESEERFRSLVTATAQMVWTTDAAGNVVDDIPSWRAYTGQTVEQIRSAGWADALHPDDLPRTLATWQRAVESRSPYEIEYRVRRHDGQYRSFAIRGVPLQNADGSIREWVGYCADITERKQAEEEICTLNRELEQRVEERTAKLRDSEERFRVLFNSGTDAIFVHQLNDDGTLSNFVEVNDVACVRLGYSRDELLQMSPADIDAPDARANIPVSVQRILKIGELLAESAHMTKDGRRIPVEISGKRFLLEGSPMVISVARDITERKAAEAKLQETLELLQKRAAELETFNQAMVGREQRIIEMKEEVNALCRELRREPKYPPVWRKGAES
ncbi:MAG: PAS domain S-box protein, partial [bacterium]